MPYNVDGRFLCIIEDVFSEAECTAFIQELDAAEKLSTVDSGLALYDRAMLISPMWAEEVKGRIRNLVPDNIRDIFVVNDHFRFSKYNDGGHFKIHRDGVNSDGKGNYSLLTLNVFLNNGFVGGETDFFREDGQRFVRAVPKPGRGALFETNVLHCGNSVSEGNKYLLRTDIMVPREVILWYQQQRLGTKASFEKEMGDFAVEGVEDEGLGSEY